MPKITYIEPSGNQVQLDGAAGWSAMQIAVSNGVEGIEAECGGSCSCATCHCYVECGGEALPPMSENELAMLEHVSSERLPSSRLACQIKLGPEIDGIVLRFPATQS